jgi:hypothetical protein
MRKLAAWCGLASLGSLITRNVFAQPFPAQPLPPSTTYAMWIHGTSVQIEFPDIIWKVERRGSFRMDLPTQTSCRSFAGQTARDPTAAVDQLVPFRYSDSGHCGR